MPNLEPPNAELLARAKEVLKAQGISVYVSTDQPHLHILVNTQERGMDDHVTAAALIERAGLNAERPQ